MKQVVNYMWYYKDYYHQHLVAFNDFGNNLMEKQFHFV